MKLGLQLGYWGSQPSDPLPPSLEAERLGYDSIWTGEAYGSDAITPLAWIGSHTTKVKLATSVMQLSARTPACAAMTALTLDHLTKGRFMLGVGVSGPQVVEGWYGQPFPKPLERTGEWLDIFRLIMQREGPVSYQGKQYQLPIEGGAGLGKPLKSITYPLRKDMPVLLGAEGPKNVQLAVDRFDGWLPIFLSPYRLSMYGNTLENLPSDFEIPVNITCNVTDNLEEAFFPLKVSMALYLGGMGARQENFHKNLMTRMGFGDEAQKVQDLFYEGKREEAIEAVPDRLVDEISLCGPRERIRERLKDWKKTPVTCLIIGYPPDGNYKTMRTIAEEVL